MVEAELGGARRRGPPRPARAGSPGDRPGRPRPAGRRRSGRRAARPPRCGRPGRARWRGSRRPARCRPRRPGRQDSRVVAGVGPGGARIGRGVDQDGLAGSGGADRVEDLGEQPPGGGCPDLVKHPARTSPGSAGPPSSGGADLGRERGRVRAGRPVRLPALRAEAQGQEPQPIGPAARAATSPVLSCALPCSKPYQPHASSSTASTPARAATSAASVAAYRRTAPEPAHRAQGYTSPNALRTTHSPASGEPGVVRDHDPGGDGDARRPQRGGGPLERARPWSPGAVPAGLRGAAAARRQRAGSGR